MSPRPPFKPRHPPPDPSEIKAARLESGLSMPAAARLVEVSASSWEKWEANQTRMPRPIWTLFKLLTKKEKLP